MSDTRCTSPVFAVVECDRCTATQYWHGEREITCRVCGCVIEVRAEQDDISELADYLEKYNEKT
jgi:purine nucleoside permease